MPYKSKAQMKFMHAKHPEIAERWDREYGVSKGLPEHVKQAKAVRRDTLPRKSGRGR